MIELLIEVIRNDFLWQASLAAMIVGLVAAPLGCCLVWQRMVYFGDALSHTTLLGAAVGVLLGMHLQISIIIVCVIMALLLLLLEARLGVSQVLSKNTLLGIVAHTSLALSLVILAINTDTNIDLYALLFGDVLSVSQMDLVWLSVLALCVCLTLYFIWDDLLAVIVHKDLAQVEGVHVKRLQIIFLLLMALVVSVAMKIVGVVLIVSLLIIPPAAVRKLVRTPEYMAIMASAVAVVSGALGLLASLAWDLPAGPAIVLMMAFIFVVFQLISLKR